MVENILLPDSILKINIELLALSKDLLKLICSNEKNPKKCQNLADKIDWVILKLANHTLHTKGREKPIISNMKEFAWELLEELEIYCNTKLQISIW